MSKMSKKILVLILILVFGTIFCLVGAGYAAEEKIPVEYPDTTGMKVSKIGLCPFQFNNWMWARTAERIHEIIKAHGGTVLDVDPMGDPVKQVEGIDRLIASGVDGILTAVIDAQAIVPSIKAANKAGIPIVFMMDAPAAGEYLSIVQPDFVLQGYQAGMALVRDVNGKGKVVLIEFPASRTCYGRIEGFLKAIAPYPDIKIVAVDIAGGNPEANTAKTAAMITADPDINAAIVAWDDIGLAMIPALKDAGLDQGQVGIYSVDGSDQVIRAMKEGKAFRATSCLYPEEMAEMCAKILISCINGKEPPGKYIGMGSGCLTWEDVQAGKGSRDVLPKDQPMFWKMTGEIIPTGEWDVVKSR